METLQKDRSRTVKADDLRQFVALPEAGSYEVRARYTTTLSRPSARRAGVERAHEQWDLTLEQTFQITVEK